MSHQGLKLVSDFDVRSKRVLLRCDFNIPLDKEGNILDPFRLGKAIPTIKFLLKNGAKLILLSHLGRPAGRFRKELSLSLIQEELLDYLDCSITKTDDCLGEEVEARVGRMQDGEILILENLRFHKEEEENNLDFAQALAGLGDIFINDAFSVSHREHASIIGIPRFLPSGIGFLFQEELKMLSAALDNPVRPLVGIVGGAKLGSKIKPIQGLLKNVDSLLVGGKIADVVFGAERISRVSAPIESKLKKIIKSVDWFHPNLKMPIDVVIRSGDGEDRIKTCKPTEVGPGDSIFDIGPETTKAFSDIIKNAGTIFWSGPLGKTDEKVFSQGSLLVARAIKGSNAFSMVGGGDTVFFLREKGLDKYFNHISTGGGAMLEYLSTGTLPALEALVHLY